jgi:hypothetical protein
MKAPTLTPMPFRAALLLAAPADSPAARQLIGQLHTVCSSLDVFATISEPTTAAAAAFDKLKHAVDFPLALLAAGTTRTIEPHSLRTKTWPDLT